MKRQTSLRTFATTLLSAMVSLLGLTACEGAIEGEQMMPPPTPREPDNVDVPVRNPVGPAELPPGRALRRMSAAQFRDSLEVATGQAWADYETYAAALGRADFAEVTEEGTEFNVTFEKLVEDAARETCAAAVEADLDEGGNIILRRVSIEERSPSAFRANLEYLLLRFWGASNFIDDDPRLAPWMTLLEAPTFDDEGEEAERTDAVMAERWAAVCVGLVTHADFVAY